MHRDLYREKQEAVYVSADRIIVESGKRLKYLKQVKLKVFPSKLCFSGITRT